MGGNVRMGGDGGRCESESPQKTWDHIWTAPKHIVAYCLCSCIITIAAYSTANILVPTYCLIATHSIGNQHSSSFESERCPACALHPHEHSKTEYGLTLISTPCPYISIYSIHSFNLYTTDLRTMLFIFLNIISV